MGTTRGSVGNGVHKPALSVLITVRGAVPSLRPAEQRVAHAVLADPAGISESSITAVARLCNTSETTVLRFCRAIGLAGYPELRIALARAAQFEETDQDKGAPLNDDIAATDPLADVVAKITHADARAITDTAAALDLAMLQKAVDAWSRRPDRHLRRRGQRSGGHRLHQKLHRIGLVSFIATEARLALTSASCWVRAMSRWGSPTPASPRRWSTRCGSPPAGGDDDRGDQLRPVADRRRGRPDPDHRRAGDHLPQRARWPVGSPSSRWWTACSPGSPSGPTSARSPPCRATKPWPPGRQNAPSSSAWPLGPAAGGGRVGLGGGPGPPSADCRHRLKKMPTSRAIERYHEYRAMTSTTCTAGSPIR